MARRTRERLWIAALALALIGASPVRAQDEAAGDPEITEVQFNGKKVSKAPIATTLIIKGKNFTADTSKIKLKAGKASCLVTVASETEIMFVSPIDGKPGKAELELTVGGKKATFPFEICKPEDFKLDSGEAGGQTAAPVVAKLLTLNALEQQPAGSGKTKVRFAGSAPKFPDGFRVMCTLSYQRKPLGNGYAEIKGRRFYYEFGPFEGKLFPGPYNVELSFQLTRQPRQLRKPFMKKLSKEEKRSYARIDESRIFEIGSADSIETLTKELKATYEKQLDAIEEAAEKLQKDYISTSRSMFRDGTSIKEDEWSAWLVKNRYINNLKEAERHKNGPYLRSGVYFNDRKWVDNVTRRLEDVGAAMEAVEGARKKYATSRFPDVDRRMTELVGHVIGLSISRTNLLYERNGLDPKREKVADKILDKAKVKQFRRNARPSFAAVENIVRASRRALDPKRGLGG